MLKAVKKTRASEDIAKQIVGLIKTGKFKKGDQLPAERELTEAFQVSRATLREAIRSLETMGMVKSRQGHGTYVLVSAERVSIAPLAASLLTDKDDLFDIFQIRKIIEPSIAQLAAGHANSEDIEELGKILAMQQADVAAGKYAGESDTLFHLTLARIAKNRVLSRLLNALVDLMVHEYGKIYENAARAEKSIEGHNAILAAIRRENCTEARKLMLNHLNEIEAVLFKEKKKRSGRCG